MNVTSRIEAMESLILGWGRRHLTMNGRMILAKTFLLSQIVFPAQVIEVGKKDVKKIEKLIYSFVNGSRSLYGPERIARINLKASTEAGGINGIDVESFLQSIAVKQYSKATNNHRILSLIQTSAIPLGDVSTTARKVLRNNFRTHAEQVAMPNVQQLQLLSGIPLATVLTPESNGAILAAQAAIVNLGQLQLIWNRRQITRSRIGVILRCLPKEIAALLRSGMLLDSPSFEVWFSRSSITKIGTLASKAIRKEIIARKFPDHFVDLGKIYKRMDWPPPGTDYLSNFSNVNKLKHPTLRAIRLKIQYKDVFSNERRHRFGLVDSPSCEICRQIETVEHQMLTCDNAKRMWELCHNITRTRVASLFDVISCGTNRGFEIVKSVILKALIQIDRSHSLDNRAILADCLYYVSVESRTDSQSGRDSLVLLQNKVKSLM